MSREQKPPEVRGMRPPLDQEGGDQEAAGGDRRIQRERSLDPVDEARAALRTIAGPDEDCGRQPESDRAPGYLEHVDDRPGETAARLLHRRDPYRRCGRIEEPDPEPEDGHARHERPE